MQACCAFWSDLDLKGLFFIPVTLQRYLLQKLLKWYLQFSSEFQNFVVSFVPFFRHARYPHATALDVHLKMINFLFDGFIFLLK